MSTRPKLEYSDYVTAQRVLEAFLAQTPVSFQSIPTLTQYLKEKSE